MEAVLCNNLLKTFTSLILGLGSSNSVDFLVKALGTLLSFPGVRTLVAKENFNFLNGLAASLGVGEPELNSRQYAEGSKDEEQTVLNVAEGWRNEKTDSEVELSHVRTVNAKKNAS